MLARGTSRRATTLAQVPACSPPAVPRRHQRTTSRFNVFHPASRSQAWQHVLMSTSTTVAPHMLETTQSLLPYHGNVSGFVSTRVLLLLLLPPA